MQENKDHISFTAEDIRKYHEGKLTPRQMHELEKASLEDPFLADALEGYTVEEVRVPADIDELKKRLQERVDDKKVIPMTVSSGSFSWLKIAAMIVAVAGAGLLLYNISADKKDTDIAQQSAKEYTNAPQNKAGEDTNATSKKADTIASPVSTAPAVNANANTRAKESEHRAKPTSVQSDEAAASAQEKELREEAKAITIERNNSLNDAAKQLAKLNPGLVIIPSDRAKESTFKKEVADTIFNNKGYVAMERGRNETASNNTYNYDMRREGITSVAPAKARVMQNALPAMNVFRGKITDQQNNPLPFANITNSNDNVGTYADAQGNFILTSPDSVMDVQVRSLGFENSTAQLQNGLNVNKVIMKADNSIAAIVLSDKKVNSKMKEGNMVLEEPEPADGWTKYDTYLANNLKIPENYKSRQKEGGEVALSFEVNHLGEPINIKVERSLCEVCDKEAIRLLREGPKWKKKAKKGKRTTITIPF